MISLEIVNQSSAKVPRKYLQSFVQSIEKKLKKKGHLERAGVPLRLTVVFIDTKEARALNREYRHKDYATDVLSFEGLEDGDLGELILCSSVLKKQAKEHSLSFRDEVSYMVLHGVLHLLGYDHERSKKEAQAMFALQDSIFSAVTGISLSNEN